MLLLQITDSGDTWDHLKPLSHQCKWVSQLYKLSQEWSLYHTNIITELPTSTKEEQSYTIWQSGKGRNTHTYMRKPHRKKVWHRLGRSIYFHNLKHNVTATNIFLKMHSLLHWGWNAEKCNKDTIIDQNPQIQPEYRHTQTLYKPNHNPADTVTWKPHVKYTAMNCHFPVMSCRSFLQLIHCRSDQKHSRQRASKFLYSHTDAAVAMRILV